MAGVFGGAEIKLREAISLFAEGHYRIDMRRYGKLASLPVDRTKNDVWEKFPLPAVE
jgi:hypothetical protein